MLSRRLIRIKVFQALFEYFQNEQISKEAGVNNLFYTLNKMHELFILNLFILSKLIDAEEYKLELEQKRYFKQPRNQKRYLKDITFLNELKNNKSFKEYVERYHISGEDSLIEVIKKVYKKIENSSLFNNFINDEESTIEKDKSFIKDLYKNFIYKSEDLYSYLDIKYIHWLHDQYYVGSIVYLYLKKNYEEFTSETILPGVFKEKEFYESDEDFTKNLFLLTIENHKYYDELISSVLENWDFDRVAFADLIILRMAITEFLFFDQIPVKSTLNEYIEISKNYSTAKSKIFVNGVLDKILVQLKREGKINKVGMGLNEDTEN